jgi:hypothetical protein
MRRHKGQRRLDHQRIGRTPQVCADLAVVENVLEPQVAHLVGDDVSDVEHRQQPAVRHFLDLLAQPAVGDQAVGRDQQFGKADVALERQHAAVEAVHRRDAPEKRQVRHKQFLHLERDHQIVKGVVVELLRFTFKKDARIVGHVAGVVGDGAHAEETPRRGRINRVAVGTGEQMGGRGAQLKNGLRRGRVRVRQAARRDQQFDRSQPDQQRGRQETRQPRSPRPQRRQPAARQHRRPQRVEHHPARRRTEEIKAGHDLVEQEIERVPAPQRQEQPQPHEEQPRTPAPAPARAMRRCPPASAR